MNGVVIACAMLLPVDGDTVKCDGVNFRPMGPGAPFVSGFDTPEIRNPKCLDEAEAAARAMVRMAEILRTPGIRIIDSGDRDKTRERRPLVWIVLPDGRTAGEILLQEGLAVEWLPGRKTDWCALLGGG